MLAPGKSYTFTFAEAGSYDYRDALYPNRTGTVKVAGTPGCGHARPQRPADFLRDRNHAVRPGQQQEGRRAGRADRDALRPTLTRRPRYVITGCNGAFAYTTKPQLLTSYQATWKGASSLAASVAVAPVITLGRNNGWITRIYAGRSMTAKTVQVQTVSAFGQWVTIKRVQIGPGRRPDSP